MSDMNLIDQVWYLIVNFYPLLIEGIYHTLLISIIGTICGTLIGIVLVIMRSQEIHFKDSVIVIIFKKILSIISMIYVDIVRGTPMMVQAAVFFYGLAYAGININPIVAGLIIVSFNTSAYICEILRSAINGITSGQFEAAKSLGFSHSQTMGYIIFPQAIRNSTPALMNELIVNIKDTSVLSIIGVTELFYMTKSAASQTYMVFASYILTAIIYLILTKTFSMVFSMIILHKEKSIPSSQTVPEVI